MPRLFFAVWPDDTAKARLSAHAVELAQRLGAPTPPLRARFAPTSPADVDSTMTPEQFRAAVCRAKEYITAGDIIQVVLAQRFSRATSAAPFDVYRCLRSINPSPYLCLLYTSPSPRD